MIVDPGQIRLTHPSSRFKASYLAGMEEDIESPDERALTDFDAFVAAIKEEAEDYPRPNGRVPSTTLWITHGEEFLGRVSIRHRLNDDLLQFGGHIGYDVRRSARRQGVGTRALALALPVARSMGIQRVLITCDAQNVGSRRIIEANGGILENAVRMPGNDDLRLRFWIENT